jgi:cyclin-dependent kinase regulatory subunit CKS1
LKTSTRRPKYRETMSDLDYNRRNKVPRPLSDSEKARLEEFIDSIHYSAR